MLRFWPLGWIRLCWHLLRNRRFVFSALKYGYVPVADVEIWDL